MSDIRINQLPVENDPAPTDNIAIDGVSTRKTTLQKAVDVAVPLASQAEAEAGVNSTKRMSPLTTSQAISAQAASSAQGDLADSAMQPDIYDPLGISRDAFGWRSVSVSISDSQFGATLSGAQTPAQRRAAIQAAFDWAAPLGIAVFIPSGTWNIDAHLAAPDKLKAFGAGIDKSIIQFSVTAAENENMLQPSAFDMSCGFIRMTDITLDGNREARKVAGTVVGVGNVRPGCSGWASMSAHDCLFERVKIVGQVLHSFDNCAGGDINTGTGRRNYLYPSGPALYSTTPSRNNTYVDCIADDWGDDGFTAHYDEYCTFIRCRALKSSQHYASNLNGSNGFEFDDGSLYGRAIDCYASYAAAGFAAKGHDNLPASSKGGFSGCFAEYCNTGVLIYGDTGAGVAEDWEVSNCKVRNPRNRDGGDGIIQGARFSNYKNLRVNGLDIEAPSYGIAPALSYGILVSNVCSDVRMEGVRVKNWPGNADPSSSALRITPNSEVEFEGEILEPGIYGIHWTGSVVSARNIKARMVQSTPIAGSRAVLMSVRPSKGVIELSQTGFDSTELGPTTYTNGEILAIEGYLQGIRRGADGVNQYTQLSDGTMLTWGIVEFIFGAADTVLSSGVTFPAAFLSGTQPIVTPTLNRESTSLSTSDFNVWAGSPSPTGINIYIRNNQPASAQTRSVSWQAIGRWY